MAFSWTDDMGPIGPSPQLEAAARAAVIAGVEFVGALPQGGEYPAFNGGRFLIPKNEAAKAFTATVLAHVPEGIGGIARETILTTAVQVANLVRKHGGGDVGWAALKAQLDKQRQQQRR